jgi:formylglycine-generating enzyme required for sulfatase activity
MPNPHRRPFRLRLGLSALLVSVSLGPVSCGGDTGTEPPVATAIDLSVRALTFDAVGASETLTATVRDQFGNALSTPVTWSTTDALVATVSSGIVTAVGNGSAEVRATVAGVTAAAAITVAQVAQSLTLTPSAVELLEGGRVLLRVSIVDANGNAVAEATDRIEWSTSAAGTVMVERSDSGGVATALAPGAATITARLGTLSASTDLSVVAAPRVGKRAVPVSGTVDWPEGVADDAAYVLTTAGPPAPVTNGSFEVGVVEDEKSVLLLMDGADVLAMAFVTPATGLPADLPVFGDGGRRGGTISPRSTALAYVMLAPLFASAPRGVHAELLTLLDNLPELDAMEEAVRSVQERERRIPEDGDFQFVDAYQRVLDAAEAALAREAGRASGSTLEMALATQELQGNGIRLLVDPAAFSSPFTLKVQNTRARDADLYWVEADETGVAMEDARDLGGWGGVVERRLLRLRPAEYIPDLTTFSTWVEIVTGSYDWGATNPQPITVPLTQATPRVLLIGYGLAPPRTWTDLQGDEWWRWGRPAARTVGFSLLLPTVEALIGLKLTSLQLSDADLEAIEGGWEFLAIMLAALSCVGETHSEKDGIKCILFGFADEVARDPDTWRYLVKPVLDRIGEGAVAENLANLVPYWRIASTIFKVVGVAETAVAVSISEPRQTFDVSYNEILGATALSVVSGDGQSGVEEQELPGPITVRVSDAGGSPVAGAWVRWDVVNGGSVASSVSTSAQDGAAAVRWTLGPGTGTQQLRVRLAGHASPEVIVEATAEAPPVETPPVTVITETLPAGVVGQAYSATLEASGGTGTYTWSVSKGTLPTNLTLSGNSISGTPTESGTWSFDVTVSSDGASASKDLSITIGNEAGLGIGFGDDQFVLIHAGTFEMGNITGIWYDSTEIPVHTVNITQPFYLQKTEVTQAQWRSVMGSNPSHFSSCGETCPVERVGWHDVQEFIEKLNELDPGKNYRLPTEAEWEYAARAGTTSDWGGTGVMDEMGWYYFNSAVDGVPQTHPVAQKPANHWGLYDMHGNVMEWVQDWYSETYYQYKVDNGIVDDPQGPATGERRVVRGGSYGGNAWSARSATRFGSYTFFMGNPVRGGDWNGFRLARTP